MTTNISTGLICKLNRARETHSDHDLALGGLLCGLVAGGGGASSVPERD